MLNGSKTAVWRVGRPLDAIAKPEKTSTHKSGQRLRAVISLPQRLCNKKWRTVYADWRATAQSECQPDRQSKYIKINEMR